MNRLHRRRLNAGCWRQQGLTLIELMVAIVIGLILTAVVIQIFIGSQQTYRFQESLSRVQENGRYGVERISRDLRMVGYQACGGIEMPINDYRSDANGDADIFADGVRGYAADGPHGYDINPLDDSEVLALGVMAPTDLVFESDSPPALSTTHGRSDFDMCDVVFLQSRSCTFGKRFYSGAAGAADVVNTSGSGSDCSNSGLGPQTDWPDIGGATALHATEVVYYVGEGDQGEPALFMLTVGTDPVELVEGVEGFHVRYGVDLGDAPGADEYVLRGDVNNWEDVVSVRIHLLVRGAEDNVTDEPQTYSFPPGTDVTAGDRRLRQVFSATTALRNRLP